MLQFMNHFLWKILRFTRHFLVKNVTITGHSWGKLSQFTRHFSGRVYAFKNLHLGKVWRFDVICSPLLVLTEWSQIFKSPSRISSTGIIIFSHSCFLFSGIIIEDEYWNSGSNCLLTPNPQSPDLTVSKCLLNSFLNEYKKNCLVTNSPLRMSH